ncbi:MAG: CehA/McbA family metallohydrolase [Limisphaerales bacterium]
MARQEVNDMFAPAKLILLSGATCVVLAMCSCAPRHRVLWGDVHGHTKLSDGKGSLDEYFYHARNIAKLDFAIVTDHDFGHEVPWRMPQAHWDLIQSKADEYTVNGQFIAIAGYEWTSQPKYWRGFTNAASEELFPGPPRYYNHKNVYFQKPVNYLFSAKDPAYMGSDLLAAAVQEAGGLVHNNHPSADLDCREQFNYDGQWFPVIANTEMLPDSIAYQGTNYPVRGEASVRAFLNRGGRTGFVGGSDTHEGRPSARTAVLARALTRRAIFDALRHRRNYAVSHARMELEFKINGHWMGEEITVTGSPRLTVSVHGTTNLAVVEIIRNGVVCHRVSPAGKSLRFTWRDDAFSETAYYYVRVTQNDSDEHGNPSRAWSSPIWVKARSEPRSVKFW